jgi:hypothetical protein
MTDGNSKKPIVTQVIEYSDFPLPEMTLCLENDVIMLSSER